MIAAGLALLSPRAALVGLVALAAPAAVALGLRRAERVRRALSLPASDRAAATRLALVAAVVALVALTAAQPALTHDHRQSARRDVQALFVLDVSRSMAASGDPRSPTRLDRAADAARRLRARIPTVASGVATLTDRVLPLLLPVPDASGFDRVLARSVSLESPPPQRNAVRATTYDALQQIPGSGYFDPRSTKRLVVVLTDGESAPVQTADIVSAFASGGFRVLFVRVWASNEAIFGEDGKAEGGYRPDPSGGALLDDLAAALRTRAYDERSVAAAGERLRRLAGSGPSRPAATKVRTQTPLAPYTAALALVAAALVFRGRFVRVRLSRPAH
ncbi:MAG TPA: VWA domain-containing protein [Gaiellaceae bacterium]|nr:VWA domain-containing protein [Gaiellaceae bacterium]